eukprot:scaffold35353_cov39-Cyclotella_meneghiniana.AAC.5
MQHDLDTMKKTTTELEDQVNMLVCISGEQELDTPDKVATIDSDSNSSAHSEAELYVLCNKWNGRRNAET